MKLKKIMEAEKRIFLSKVKMIIALCMIGVLLCTTSKIVQATEDKLEVDMLDTDKIDLSEFQQLELNSNINSVDLAIDKNAPTSLEMDETKEQINLSGQLNQRSAYKFADNPNAGVSGKLTEANTNDIYFFNITENAKFLVGRLQTVNAKYMAVLYVLDSEGNASATGIYGTADKLMQLNGLPMGEYAVIVLCSDNTYGNDYVFNINATNPSANIKTFNFLANDLSIFMFETEDGDVYGNGSFIYNTTTKQGSKLSWQRIERIDSGSGFMQRTHQVFNVKVKSISGPAKYSASKAASDCAVLICCDVDTSFSYIYSLYESGDNPTHVTSATDTTGRVTPRQLDEVDFSGGREHIIVFDLNEGKAIDFYSNLNIYYAGGYEPAPKVTFYQ